jgi:hypothetical protein
MRMIAVTGTALAMLSVTPACGANSAASDTPQQSSTSRALTASVIWHEQVEVAVGGGHRGPWRMNRSEWDFVDDPTVAINDQGFVGVAWAYHAKQDVLFQLYLPDGTPRFDEPVNVSRSSSIFSWLPRMILTDADDVKDIKVYLVWQEIVFSGGSHGGEIFFARSTDGGATFSRPINLSRTTAGAGKGRLTARYWHNGSYDFVRGPRGDLFITWTEYEGNLWFSRSTNDGRTFSPPMHIAGGDERGEPPARGPALAVDQDNRIYLAWTVGEQEDANIQLATSDDGGETFTPPRAVHERPGHADAPKLAVDGRGVVHLAYMESPRGPLRRYHIRYANASRDDLAFSEPREISREQQGRTGSIGFPMLRMDGEDHLYLTWELFRDPRGRPLGLGFTRSVDGGETFTPPVIVPGTADFQHGLGGGLQGLLKSKLAVNRSGEFAIVNSTYLRDEASRVWLMRGRVEKASTRGADGAGEADDG